MSELDEVVDDLYSGPPAEFIARRDAAVRAARADKDGESPAPWCLRKPTVSAWLVNLLVRDDAELAGQIVALGEGLRDAEKSLDGPALRELSKQRRQLVRSLVARARKLAQPTGQKIGDAVVQTDATLTAALADPAVAREVVSGAADRRARVRRVRQRGRPSDGPAPTPAPAPRPPKPSKPTPARGKPAGRGVGAGRADGRVRGGARPSSPPRGARAAGPRRGAGRLGAGGPSGDRGAAPS